MSTDFIEVFWRLDQIIAAAFAVLFLFFLTYALIREALEKQRKKALARIRDHLEAYFVSSLTRSPGSDSCPAFIDSWSPQQFLSVIKSHGLNPPRGSKGAGDFQQELRDCMLRSPKFLRIEKKAAGASQKWQRIEALLVLGYIQAPGGQEILSKGLLSPDEDICYFSMLSLSQFRDRPSARILLSFLTRRRFSGYKIVSLLESFPEDIVEDVLETLEGADFYARFWGLKLLAKFKPMAFFERIERFSRDPYPDVRAAACICLAEMGPVAQTPLKECLKDNIWFVRMHAVRGLSKALGKACLPLIADLSLDPYWLVKESVEKVMADHIEEAMPYIDSCLIQPDKLTAASCVNALINSSYIPQLLKDAASDHPVKRERAEKLLSHLLKTDLHFGLKKSLGQLPDVERQKVLELLARMDPSVAASMSISGGPRNAEAKP
ncbi:MAG: HEAT repeat domain-containing protein [Candidatus Omnitrophota bacterium]